MSDAIVVLQLEHLNIGKVLDLVRQQLTNMTATTQAPVNFYLLEGCLEYLLTFPDRCHHPKEDLLYRTLVARFPDVAGTLREMVAEHEILASATRHLRAAVGAALSETPEVTPELIEDLNTFLQVYRRHMLMEEQYFFPLVLQRLSPDELAYADFTLFDLPDHVFDQDAEKRLAALHDAITAMGAAEQENADPATEAAWLASVQDIAAFNEAMRCAGDSVALSRSVDGGYVLKRKGEVLVHIPACSESRAAWCAYFFRKAGGGAEAMGASAR